MLRHAYGSAISMDTTDIHGEDTSLCPSHGEISTSVIELPMDITSYL